MSEIGSEPGKPVWMAFVPNKPKMKDAIILTILSIMPIALAVLMQKPALRQAIQMRTYHTSKIICQDMADFWQVMATKSAQGYQKVQL
jgi:hypothetical protein